MSSADDSDIIIEESHNLGDDAIEPKDTPMESSVAFDNIMQKQGITIEVNSGDVVTPNKNLKDFSKELLNQGGVEIVSSEEGV